MDTGLTNGFARNIGADEWRRQSRRRPTVADVAVADEAVDGVDANLGNVVAVVVTVGALVFRRARKIVPGSLEQVRPEIKQQRLLKMLKNNQHLIIG